MNIKHFIFVGIGISGAWGANAASLLDAYKMAKENDPQYQSGLHEHDSSKEVYKQARADLLPTLDLKYGTYDVETTTKGDNTISQPDEQKSFTEDQTTLDLKQSIYSYSRWAAFKKSKAQVGAADAELLRTEQDLLLRVSEAYFNALADYDEYTASLRERDSMKAHYELVEVKRASGLVSETELFDSRARFLESEANTLQLASKVKDSLQVLVQVTGQLPETLMPLGEGVELTPPTPADPQEWVKVALEQSPELKVKSNLVSAAEQERKRNQGAHYPTLDLEYTSSENDHQGNLLGDTYNTQEDRLGIVLNVPLFASGAVTSRVRQSTALYSKTVDEKDRELRAVRRNTLSAYEGVLTEIARVDALGKSVESYQKALEIKRVGYRSGVSSSLTLLDAERDLFVAQTKFIRARYQYVLNTVRLKRTVGVLNEADLTDINSKLSGEIPLVVTTSIYKEDI